jgi:hypothetical protein
MPALACLIPFFIVFSSRAMGLRRKFMLLSGSQVCPVRGFVVYVGHGFPPVE